MTKHTTKYLIISQSALVVSLIVCVILIPGFLFAKNEGGISNYGLHLKTVVPYSLGFLIAAFYLLKTALSKEFKLFSKQHLRQPLIGYAAFLILVLITTYGYKTNVFLKNTHITVTILIACFELLAAGWLYSTILRDKINIALLFAQFIGFVMGAATFLGYIHLLFISQLIMIITFGTILIRSYAKAQHQHFLKKS